MGVDAPQGFEILSLALETLCDALDQAVLVFSRSDTLIYASKHVQKFYPVPDEFLKPETSLRNFLRAVFDSGMTRAIPGSPVQSHPDAEEWISQHIASLWNERSEKTERIGRERWVSVVSRRLASGMGIMMLQDASAMHKLEERWQSDMARVGLTEDILDNLPQPLSVKDRNLAYVAVNKAFCKLHGMSADSLLGGTLWDLLDPAMAEYYESEERKVLETGKPSKYTQELIGPDDEIIRVVKQRYRIGKPGHYFVVTIMDDITGEVKAAPDVAFEPDETVSQEQVPDFGDAIADDEIAMDGTTPDDDTGRLLIWTSDEKFGSALQEALSGFQFDALHVVNFDDAKAIFKAAAETGLPVDLIIADEEDWNQQKEGAREFGHAPVVPVARGRPAHFVVADVAAAITRKLAIIGAQADDRQAVSSAPELSVIPDFDAPDENAAEVSFGIEVLVAEDNPINQEVFKQILSGLGISFQIANDGTEAVRLWETLRPALMLMDTGLPSTDGIAAAERIRAMEAGSGCHSAIVGVLPNESQQEREACLSAGMNDVIVKPLSVESIEKLYRKYVLESFITSKLDRAV